MVQEYKEMVEKIPAEMRWAIAARALTGVATALEAAIQDALGPEKRREIATRVWTAGAAGIKQLVDALGLPTDDAKAAANAVATAVTVAMGPESQGDFIEATPTRVVSRITGCAPQLRMKEMGVTLDCMPVCTAHMEAMYKALNPRLVFRAGDKCIGRGDPYCGDAVIELRP